MYLLLRRNKRKKLIEASHGELSIVPWLMQDIESKEAKLGNTAVDGAVGKTAGLLDMADKIAHDIPGSVFGSKRKHIKKFKISTNVGRI